MTAQSLPLRPDLDQLKRQAKELLRRQPRFGRLRDAQRAVAQQYGFDSWDAFVNPRLVGQRRRSCAPREGRSGFGPRQCVYRCRNEGKRDVLLWLLEAGVRVPPVLTGCQAYLLEHTDMLRTLLAHGGSPSLTTSGHQAAMSWKKTGSTRRPNRARRQPAEKWRNPDLRL